MVLTPLNRLPIGSRPFELEPRVDIGSPTFGNPLRHVVVFRFFIQCADRRFVGRAIEQCLTLLNAHLPDEGQFAGVFFLRCGFVLHDVA